MVGRPRLEEDVPRERVVEREDEGAADERAEPFEARQQPDQERIEVELLLAKDRNHRGERKPEHVEHDRDEKNPTQFPVAEHEFDPSERSCDESAYQNGDDPGFCFHCPSSKASAW